MYFVLTDLIMNEISVSSFITLLKVNSTKNKFGNNIACHKMILHCLIQNKFTLKSS